MYATLFGALGSLALWAFLLATLPPSGWLHLPLAVGTTLLVRWIALSDRSTVSGTAAGRPDPT
jgi:hypothetical protein